MRDQIYPQTPTLSYRYVFDNTARVQDQLARGGVRLAAYMDNLFAPGAAASRR